MVPKLVNFFSFLQIDWLIIDRLCNWIWFFCQKKRQPLLIFFLMWIFDKVDFCLILQQVLLIVLVSFSWVFHFLILSQVFLHSFSKLFKIDKIFSVILNFFSNFCVCVFFLCKTWNYLFFSFSSLRNHQFLKSIVDRSIDLFIYSTAKICLSKNFYFFFISFPIDWLIDRFRSFSIDFLFCFDDKPFCLFSTDHLCHCHHRESFFRVFCHFISSE